MSSKQEILLKVSADAREANENLKQSQAAVKELKDRMAELKDENKKNTDEYKNLKAELKEQKEAVSDYKKELDKLEDAHKKSIDTNKELEKTLNDNLNSQRSYQNQNEDLVRIREKLRATDDNYIENLERIRAQIEQNNEKIAEANELQTNGTLTIGYYKDKVTEAFDAINVFNGGISGFVSRAQAAGGVGKLFSTSLSGMTQGIKGMGQAIAANPLGILLSVLGPLIQKLSTFTPVTRAVEQAMASLSPVLNLVTAPMQWMAKGIGTIVEGFASLVGSMSDSAGKAVELAKAEQQLNTEKILQEELNETAKRQIDDLIEKSEDQTLSIKERSDALAEAARIENENLAQQKAIAEESYRVAAGKLQESKNLTKDEIATLESGTTAEVDALMETKSLTDEELKTFREALSAKKQLQADETDALKDQKKKREALRKEEAENAKKEADDAIKRQKDKLALFVAENASHKNSLDQQINYEKAFTQRSISILKDELAAKKLSWEQYKAQVTQLQTQLRDNVEKIRKGQLQQNVESLKQELDVLLQNHDAKKSTLQQELDFQKMISQKKQEIINAEYEASDKTSADAHARNMARAEETKNLAAQNAEVALSNANAQLNVAEQLFERRKQGETEVTAQSIALDKTYYDQRYQLKLQELQQGNAFNAEELKQKYASGQMLTTAESDYLTNVLALQNEYSGQKKSLHDQENALQIEGIRKKYEEQRANATSEFDLQRIAEAERHEVAMTVLKQQLEDKKITQDEYNAKEAAETKTNADNKKKIDTAVFNNKLDLASQTFTNLQALVGKESAAGKAMAVAQATIDTYKAAVSAYAAMSAIPIVGPALGAVAAAAAVAAGIANVKKITSTKTPKAEKGALFSIGGKRHSQGGTLFTGEDGTRFEAEKGEIIGVMNRNAARHFMAFNNTFPAGGSGSTGGNYFAQGGIVSREVAQQAVNLDELAAKIAQANAAIPAPVVTVQDIVTQSSSYVKVRQAANF